MHTSAFVIESLDEVLHQLRMLDQFLEAAEDLPAELRDHFRRKVVALVVATDLLSDLASELNEFV